VTEPSFRVYPYGDENPQEDLADAREVQEHLLDNIAFLMAQELSGHLLVPHDCQPGCYSRAAVDIIMNRMPESQVRFLAMEMLVTLCASRMKDATQEDAGD